MTTSPSLVAHSPTEIELYLLATACEACGHGPLSVPKLPERDRWGETDVSLEVTCRRCGAGATKTFRLATGAEARDVDASTPINPTVDASRIIDVAQWLTLHRLMTEMASHEGDKGEARRLALRAGHCLTEALKFYDDADNDLPPPEALFTEESRLRLRDNPARFSRTRLLNLRAALPTEVARRRGATATQERIADESSRRPKE